MTLVTILGMHRSGTSLCAQICQLLGVYLGNDLIPGRPDNPDGYFEDRFIVEIQSDILDRLGRRWTKPEGLLRFPKDWQTDPTISEYGIKLLRRLNELLAHTTSGLAGFKDPRTARLLPLWERLYGISGLDPLVILSVRNPFHVGESLRSRQGFGQARSNLLWLQHNVAALGSQRRIIVIDYDRWFSDPTGQLNHLARFLGVDFPAVSTFNGAITDMIDHRKRHYLEVKPAYFQECDDLYALLRSLSCLGPDIPLQALRDRAANCLRDELRLISDVLEQLKHEGN